jgi:lysozyme
MNAARTRGSILGGGAFAVMAIAAVAQFEGFRPTAYLDIVGVPTICYGATRGVTLGETATKQECDARLLDELREYEAGMLACLETPLPPKVQVAFVSLTYNIGTAAFCRSSVARHANVNDLAAACDAILKWNKAGGREIAGLTRRRQAERKICREGLR